MKCRKQLDTTSNYNKDCSWTIRNNSGNVSGALYNHLQSPVSSSKKRTIISYKKEAAVPPTQCRECYCKKLPIYPKLCLKAPEICYDIIRKCTDGSNNNVTCEANIEEDTACIAPNTRCCNEETPSEQSLECNGEQSSETKSACKTSTIDGVFRTLEDFEKLNNVKHDDIAKGNTNYHLDLPEEVESDLSKLKNFRTQNYFDCHSTSVNINHGGVENHKCIHTFTVNDRLYPVPMNPDPYGVSRCIICDSPKKSPNVTQRNYCITGGKPKRSLSGSSTSLQSLIPKYNFHDTIILKLPETLELCKNTYKKRNIPPSSLALRHQKFVL